MPRGRKPSVSDDEIISVFQQATDPVLTTREVADRIDLGERATYNRLQQLVTEGTLRRKEIGELAVVWWYPPMLDQFI